MLTTTSYQNQFSDLSQNTTSTNKTRGLQLVNQSLRYLVQKYFFNEQQYQTMTIADQQVYTLPFDAKDVINETVLVGGILWQPLESPNRQFWDSLNTVPFDSDFPQFSYRFKANQIQLFPIPTSNNNVLTINYKRRIKDLSAADYTAGTVSVNQWKLGQFIATANSASLKGTSMSYTPALAVNDTVKLSAPTSSDLPTGFSADTTYYVISVDKVVPSINSAGNTDFTFQLSASEGGDAITPTSTGSGTLSYLQSGKTITGSSTSWTTNMQNRWINIPETTSNTTSGDNRWYQIQSVESSTSLTLYNDYQGEDVSGATYIIGEVPILPEDYQDLALYRALWIYYTSIVPDATQAKGYQQLYEAGKEILDFEFGSKSTNPVLTPPNAPTFNPNLFPRISN